MSKQSSSATLAPSTSSTTAHDRLRSEIEHQVDEFLRQGGQIEIVHNQLQSARPIGPVWWDTRGSGLAINLGR